MCFGGKGSWANQVLGPCLDGTAATRDDVDRMARWYEERGSEPKVQVVPFADRSLVRELGEAGFRLKEFESVFMCDVHDRTGRAVPTPDGVEIGVVDVADAPTLEACVRVMAGAFVPEPSESLLRSTRKMAAHPRIVTLAARIDGRVVGVGQVELAGEVAGMCGAGVVEAFRRRGIQGALMESRLRIAQERGCSMMTVTTFPGIATERNAMRFGFAPSYTKAVLVRPGEGLVPSP
jgi:GNAT superfamily N-acetyltransferase